MILLLNFSVLSWFIYWAGWPSKRPLPSDQNITEKRVLRKWFRQLLTIPWDLTRPLRTSQIFQSKFFWKFCKGLCHNLYLNIMHTPILKFFNHIYLFSERTLRMRMYQTRNSIPLIQTPRPPMLVATSILKRLASPQIKMERYLLGMFKIFFYLNFCKDSCHKCLTASLSPGCELQDRQDRCTQPLLLFE